MTSNTLKHLSATWWWCLLTVALILHFQCSRVLAFHCHRKHDHSSDILLQGDSEHYLQSDTGHAAVAASSSNSFYSAKLVQQLHQPSKIENKRDLVEESISSHDSFCPDLKGCACNVTSGTNHLQVSFTICSFSEIEVMFLF